VLPRIGEIQKPVYGNYNNSDRNIANSCHENTSDGVFSQFLTSSLETHTERTNTAIVYEILGTHLLISVLER